jgi:hypothetical protein
MDRKIPCSFFWRLRVEQYQHFHAIRSCYFFFFDTGLVSQREQRLDIDAQ